MKKTPIHSAAAPAAIGPYSQAIRSGQLVFLSGQIPLDPETMELVEGDIESSTRRVFDNLSAVATESGGSLNDIVKLSLYLTDLNDYPTVNRVMEDYFSEPFPARAAFAVAALPKNASIEVEGILALDG